jgi:tripartite-type tricarboxylate transporter receptor subunit TctC
MLRWNRLPGLLAASALLWAGAANVLAQDFPARPFRVLVGFPPGSTGDAIARTVADGLTKRFGQPAIVENKTGANGAFAAETVARAHPDGYTLLVSNTSSITVNPILYKKLGYSVPKDFAPITTLITYPLVLSVNPNGPRTRHVRTVADLVALARSESRPLTFGSGGNGNLLQLQAEQLALAAGFQATHIPYRGGAPMQLALLAGEIDFDFDTLAVIPQVKAGKLRALAVTESVRWEELPDVPTVAELGYPTVQLSAWIGLLAPAGTPREVLEKIHQAMVEMGADPIAKTRLQAHGRMSFKTPAQLTEQIAAELALNADIVKKANITAE